MRSHRSPAGRSARVYALVAIAMIAALSLSGCVSFPAEETDPPIAAGIVPTPPGAETDVPPEAEPNLSDCDATSSLRPPPQMPPPGEMPPASTMSRIFDHGRLIVGLDIGSNLFSFRDPISGDIQGFDVEIARELARAIFDDPLRVEFRVLSSSERIQALQAGTVDVIVKTMSITCDRLRDVSFSSPYYIASQRILAVRGGGISGPADLADRRVCAARGTTSIAQIQSIAPTASLVSTTTWADCLVMLQQGQVDAISTDDAILAGLAAQDPWVEVVGPSLGEEYYGVGVPHGQDDLVRFLNGVLEQVRTSGRWYEIYERWLSILGWGFGAPAPTYRD